MIGVFDSGIGGLSVLNAIHKALPQVDLVYIADTAHVPYGSKPEAFIRERVLAIGKHLVDMGCRLLVVACNTATVSAIHALREAHPGVPVVGVEPGVKPAAASSKSRTIAVLATEATARSERLAELIAEHATQLKVLVQPCPGWASRVEAQQLQEAAFHQEVADLVLPLLAAGADRLVLGCTHYSFLTPIIAPLIKGRTPSVELVDVAAAVARQVQRLYPHNSQHETSELGKLTLAATAHPEALLAALHGLGLSELAARTKDHPLLLAAL